VPRSCDRAERDWAAPSACRLRRVLHAIANASRARQGHAKPALGHTAVKRSYRRHSRSRRSASPLQPHRGVAVAQRRSQLQPAAPPVPLTLLCCPELRSMSAVLRASSRVRRGLARGLRTSKWSALSSNRLFDRHSIRVQTIAARGAVFEIRACVAGANLSSPFKRISHAALLRRVDRAPATQDNCGLRTEKVRRKSEPFVERASNRHFPASKN